MNNLVFNEAEYLSANPDVTVAVKEGRFRSGLEHYKIHGEKEGRQLNRLCAGTSREEKVFHFLDKAGLGLQWGK